MCGDNNKASETLVADTDPSFYFNADPELDPAFYFKADLDPAPHQIDAPGLHF